MFKQGLLARERNLLVSSFETQYAEHVACM